MLFRYVRCKRRDQTFFIPCTLSDTVLQLKQRIVRACQSTSGKPSTIDPEDEFTSKLMGKRSSRRTAAPGEETTIITSPSDIKLFHGVDDEKQEVVNASTVADYDFDCGAILYMVYRRHQTHQTLHNEDSDYDDEGEIWEDIQVDEWMIKD